MTLKPWREVAVPHEDVLKGTFQQAEFAADLSRVHEGTATPEYQNPALFFQRTFITEGMRLLLDSVVKEITQEGVVIERNGEVTASSNDAIIVCVGGELPSRFLKGIGVIVETRHGE